MSQGIRNNKGKPQWSQVHFPSLEPMVRVLEHGAEKVGKDNWRKGLLVLEICESMLRHTFALMDGEDNDKKSGLPHVGHIQSNAMFLAYMLENRPDMDNRVKANVEVQTEEYFDSSGKSINDSQKYIYEKSDYERLVEKWGEDKARELLGITP